MLLELIAREGGKVGPIGDFSLLFLDEVHEFSFEMVLILALLKRMPVEKRNFGIIIMSATGPAELFCKYMGTSNLLKLIVPSNAPVEHVSVNSESKLLKECTDRTCSGYSCLIFCNSIPHADGIAAALKKAHPMAEVKVLHGTLSKAAQAEAIREPEDGIKKFICSTAVAETSLTVKKLQVVGDFRTIQHKIFYPLAN